MRHATRTQRLSLPSEHRAAVLHGLVRELVIHGQIRTTYARAKEAQRLADRLVTLGKAGDVPARRRAFRVLQDRALVKQLFGEIAPRYVDLSGGYTRVLRLSIRRGDGAQRALLAFSRLPAGVPAAPPGAKPAQPPQAPAAPTRQPAQPAGEAKKSKGLFEGLRHIWTRKKKGAAAS
ncbi:MAG: 50S ribosomal protein L17 [Candidatus Omnitrophica bacterium]|nr:50S ribosomal protein L17 [Candidatus Omnitrophota bacterium]